MIKDNRILFFLLLIIGVALTSVYFFPFEFKFIRGINTKKIMAALGLVVLGLRLAQGKGPGNGMVQKDFFWLSVYAVIVSLASLFSVVVNGTPDYAYASYIMSFWVWIGGAYAVCRYINWLHGKLSIPLVGNYLVAVVVFQCVMALWMDLNPTVKDFVDTYIEQGQDFLNSSKVHRMYGIGASLDVAGIRFSCVLIIIAYLICCLEKTRDRKYLPFYLLSFAIITVIGNMIARTTTVGVGIGLAYIFFSSWERGLKISWKAQRVWKWIAMTLIIAIPLSVYYYNNDETMRKHIRFAFEGFFAMVEKGKWETASNNTLEGMIVFPETMKTWIMGDGYFDNPIITDPYFIGKFIGGYYMGTDIGYLRFIFYFGLIGLLAFSNFFWQACKVCYQRFKGTTFLFVMILLCNFIVWLKVATDTFLVFALFLCIGAEENEEYMKSIALEQEEDKQE